MTSKTHQRRRADRIRLILEVRKAHRRFADLLQKYPSDSPPVHSQFARATHRLSAMKHVLALVALEAARPSRLA
jgi:hypothetical protein